jgi:hypothetical protein
MDLASIVALLQSLGWGSYVNAVLTIIGVCALIAMVAPGPRVTGWTNSPVYRAVYAVLQWCAANKFHATPLASPAATGIVGGGGAISNPQMAASSVPATSQIGVQLVAAAAVKAQGT